MRTAFFFLLFLTNIMHASAPGAETRVLKSVGAIADKLPRFGKSSNSITWMTHLDGSLYVSMFDGTSSVPEDPGILFRYNLSDGTLARAVEFNGNNGFQPIGTLVQSATPGVYYGITHLGGKHNCGTIYSYDSKTSKQEVLVSFGKKGPIYPDLGLVAINDHEYIGICDYEGELDNGEDSYNFFRTGDAAYIFNSKTNEIRFFTVGSEFGNVSGLPVRINNTLVFMFANKDRTIFAEYSIASETITSFSRPDFHFQALSGLKAGKDSCLYAMNYTYESNSLTYLFLRYDMRTKKCSQGAVGTHYLSMYSGDFAMSDAGSLYGYFKMGIDFGNGLVFRYDPATDSIDSFITWPEDYDAVNDEDNTQLTPGYDFNSNSVIVGDSALFAVSWRSGLVKADMLSRRVTRLVKF